MLPRISPSPFRSLIKLAPRTLKRVYSVDYESKYAEQLRRRAEKLGVDVLQLKAQAKKEQQERRPQPIEPAAFPGKNAERRVDVSPEHVSPSPISKERKDSSPIRSLSSLLNVPRLFSTPHTSAQISSLWTVYHASRSGGTGRGFVSATIPLAIYQKMESIAERYPCFVVPLPRPRDPSKPSEGSEGDVAYEFYFLEWNFYDSPKVPSAVDDPFAKSNTDPPHAANPRISTVMFTPLIEYKMRNSFATPYFVLTNYTDLAVSHGITLLRGEITPSSTSGSESYLLSQVDAQLLSVALQKFYLWKEDGGDEAERLLRTFNERPQEFNWEEVLKFAK